MGCTNAIMCFWYSLITQRVIIFTLHCGKGELEQLDSAAQAGLELISLIIDQYQQNELSEGFI